MDLIERIRRTYLDAAEMLVHAQGGQVPVLSEIGSVVASRPRASLSGYTRIGPRVAIAAPDDARIEVRPAGGNGAVALLVGSAAWLTLEAFITVPAHAQACVMDLDIVAVPPRPVLADTFLRLEDGEGAVADTAPQTLELGNGRSVISMHAVTDEVRLARAARLIVSIREPAGRLELHGASLIVA